VALDNNLGRFQAIGGSLQLDGVGRRRNFVGQHFGARGYWVSTVGKNEAAVRQYIQNQEKEDKRLEQLELVAL
jgi:hypothetical protein